MIDIAGSARFWRMVRQVQRRTKASELSRVAFDAKATPFLMTERFPAAPVMAPGEMSAIVTELMADCSANPENDKAVLEYYHDLLFDLVHDWRNHWSLYGFMAEGFEGYQRLLQQAQGALKPDPRVLVTQSNKVGINPIINQRLLAQHSDPVGPKSLLWGVIKGDEVLFVALPQRIPQLAIQQVLVSFVLGAVAVPKRCSG